MNRISGLLGLLLFFFAFTGMAQTSGEEANVEKVIATLFEGMKSKDRSLLESVFHEKAILHTVIEESGNTGLRENSVNDFLGRIAAIPVETVLDERILSYNILIDGDMAAAWTPYRFYINDNFSHCGVNSFQLIKTNGNWMITYIIDTRKKEGCK